MKRKYVCLNNKQYDGTIFVTQVADWLKVYSENDVLFDYYHLSYYTYLWNWTGKRQQLNAVKNVIPSFRGHSYCFPSRGIFVYLNAVLWYFKLMKYFKKFDEILLFSRNIIGKEINILKKIAPIPILFYFDARAASAEENRYAAVKKQDFSYKKYKTFAHILYTEFITVTSANRIFSVSSVLRDYFHNNYNIPNDKVFIYPCLSDAEKFYYDEQIRDKYRKLLHYTNNENVYLYAGGIAAEYHITDSIFSFFSLLSKNNENSRFLLLSKDKIAIETKLEQYPELNNKLVFKNVSNSEMNNYLNAADFGLLIRENVLMNNVASPSKFAEYMLCGLPTIISEGVGDYSKFCEKEKVGVVVSEEEMNDWYLFDYTKLLKTQFSRKIISTIGKNYFSKQSLVKDIIIEFKI